MPAIAPLLLEDQPRITDFLTRHPPEISELTFTNLFVWGKSRPVFHLEMGDSLVFLVTATDDSPAGGYTMLGPPVGDIPIPEVAATLGNKLLGVARLAGGQVEYLKKAGIHLEEDRDNADYVYLTEDLANLAGGRYAKKRNRVKKCLQNYRCEYHPLTAGLIPECLAMQERWCRARQCGRDPGLCGEYDAILQTFALYGRTGLIGGTVMVDGTVQAYALAERLGPETAVWHFEKAMPGIDGLGQLINHWFARYGLSAFRYVNREQDLGIDGLRQAKESYHPHHMVRKFTARFTGDPLQTASPKTGGCAEHD